MLFKYSVRTSSKTQTITITKINRFMPFRGIIAVYSENIMKPTIHFTGKKAELLILRTGGTLGFKKKNIQPTQ